MKPFLYDDFPLVIGAKYLEGDMSLTLKFADLDKDELKFKSNDTPYWFISNYATARQYLTIQPKNEKGT